MLSVRFRSYQSDDPCVPRASGGAPWHAAGDNDGVRLVLHRERAENHLHEVHGELGVFTTNRMLPGNLHFSQIIIPPAEIAEDLPLSVRLFVRPAVRPSGCPSVRHKLVGAISQRLLQI